MTVTRRDIVIYQVSQAVNMWIFDHPEPAKEFHTRIDMMADLNISHLYEAYDKAIKLCEENDID